MYLSQFIPLFSLAAYALASADAQPDEASQQIKLAPGKISLPKLCLPKVPEFKVWCADGECHDNCICSSDARKLPTGFTLRKLCKAGECAPEECMCAEEVVQGIHELIVGSSNKVDTESIQYVLLSLAQRLQTPGGKPGKTTEKNEL